MSLRKRLQLDQTTSAWRILRAPYTRALRRRQARSGWVRDRPAQTTRLRPAFLAAYRASSACFIQESGDSPGWSSLTPMLTVSCRSSSRRDSAIEARSCSATRERRPEPVRSARAALRPGAARLTRPECACIRSAQDSPSRDRLVQLQPLRHAHLIRSSFLSLPLKFPRSGRKPIYNFF